MTDQSQYTSTPKSLQIRTGTNLLRKPQEQQNPTIQLSKFKINANSIKSSKKDSLKTIENKDLTQLLLP